MDSTYNWQGGIFKTTDGGKTWVRQHSGYGYDFNCIHCIDANTCYVGANNGLILKTINGGAPWIHTGDTLTTQPIWGIYFINTSTGWVVGDGWVIRKTINGGDTWLLIYANVDPENSGVQFVDVNTGWIIRGSPFSSPSARGDIYKTTDGGNTWISQTPEPIPSPLNNLFFINHLTGWIVGTEWDNLKNG